MDKTHVVHATLQGVITPEDWLGLIFAPTVEYLDCGPDHIAIVDVWLVRVRPADKEPPQ